MHVIFYCFIALIHMYFQQVHHPPFTKSVINMCLSFRCQSEVQHAICNRRICGNNAEESQRQNHCNKWETVWMWKGNKCIAIVNLYNVQKRQCFLIFILPHSSTNMISRSRTTNSYPQPKSHLGLLSFKQWGRWIGLVVLETYWQWRQWFICSPQSI